MEPDDYDRDRAQLVLNTYQQVRTTPPRSYSFDLGLSVDANFQGTDSTPPIVLLNFMYGVAAYKRWRSPHGVGIINAYFAEHYKPIPLLPSPKDSDYLPEDTNSMVEAMDELNMVLMYLSGITPEEAAIRREKRLEEEEKMAQEAGRRKVMEWVDTVRT